MTIPKYPFFMAIMVGVVFWSVGFAENGAARPSRAERVGNDGERRIVRIAGVVLKWIRTDKEANFRRAELLIRQAAGGGAQIVCTTECFLDGYAIADKSIPLEEYRALGESIPGGAYFQRLRRLAEELKIHLAAGMLEADGEQRYNTVAWIGPDGRLLGKYRKQKLGHEAERNTAGEKSSVFETPFGRVGVMICADRRDPDVVRRFLKAGADFLLCPSGGMFGPKTNDPILQARSRENDRYIVFVHPAEFLVTGPDGSILHRTILGDRLLITPEEEGGEGDANRVFYFDLPFRESQPAPNLNQETHADVVIRGGRIYDGSGGEPFVGDVALKGDRIVAVGQFSVTGDPKIVEAKDLCVAPGFIDLHNHSDRSITAEKTRPNVNYLRQGCTTIVTGNCGSGVVDVAKYFETLERHGAGTNVSHLVPQGAVRKQVLGLVDRPPTDEEMVEMRLLVGKAMNDGAFGLSTGLAYLPGSYSRTDELARLTEVVANHGGFYASHIRTQGVEVLKSIDEAITIGKQAGCPVHISHLKASGPAAWGLGSDIRTFLAAARSQGVRVTADQYPYTASSTSLTSMLVPAWAREGGGDQLRERMDDAQTGPRIRSAMVSLLEARGGGERLMIARYSKRTDWVGKILKKIAEDEGRTSLDVAWEIIHSGGASSINFSMSPEDVRMITAGEFVATASDGSAKVPGQDKPHPRSYGTFPRKIGEYAHRRGWLSVTQAIRSATGLPADILGYEDRGYLKVGFIADLVVFDLEELRDHATFQEPHRYSTGFSRVYVAGKAAVIDDRPTGILAGRPIRHVSSSHDRNRTPQTQ